MSTMSGAPLPPMPLEPWIETKETLHRFLQVVGKVKLDQAPPRNHWWHVPFHLTGRGITTRPMGRELIFCIDLDFLDHRLAVTTVRGPSRSFSLEGLSVAAFHERLFTALREVGIDAAIRPVPFDLTDRTPFPEDHAHATYDPQQVTRYWHVLSAASLMLEEFAGRCFAKTSPVHHFWHTFDLAVTRFSDKRVVHGPDVDPVTREAYSHEVVSSGFWFGDQTFPEPAFYSYTSPEPEGLAEEPLLPAQGRWVTRGASHLAVLPYEVVRTSPDPRATVLTFLESAYAAGASRAGWDVEALRSHDAPDLT